MESTNQKRVKRKMEKAQIEKAVKALLKHLNSGDQKKNNDLLQDAADIWILITTQIYLLFIAMMWCDAYLSCRQLPNPIYNHEQHQICMFVKDPQREYKDKLKSLEIQDISKVIGIRKLKKKYKSHEAKRQLCNGFDLFLADDRVLATLPPLLGKSFFDTKKLPISLNLKKQDIKAEIESAISSTFFYHSKGSCSSVRVGREWQSQDEIVANVEAAIEGVIEKIPGKWKNIKGIHLKTSDSISLPLFVSLPHHHQQPEAQDEITNENKEKAVVMVEKKLKKTKKQDDIIDIYAEKDDKLLKKLSNVIGMKLID